MKRVVLTRIKLFEFYTGKIDYYQAFQGCYENKSFSDVIRREDEIKKIIKERYPFIERLGRMESDANVATLFIPYELFDFTKKQKKKINKKNRQNNYKKREIYSA